MTEPRRLGKYELQKRLAHGGMGEVWKALDTQLQRYVAIKLLRTDLQHDPDFIARFEREAQLIASLRHPNIVKIHDFQISYPPESETTQAYMIMDYVEGQTLADYIRNTSRKGQFPSPSDLIYIFTGTSLAIDYAHRQGMIHRDIKPANILLDQRLPTPRSMGEPILTDFGIARLQESSGGTMFGSLLGTPLYISPEQANSEHSDKRSDLYSLGIILYEMTTGVTPFRGDTTIAILMQHIHELPTPPALINPKISPALSAVILKSIEKQPEDRFQSAAAMTIAIARAFNLPVPRAFVDTPPRASSAPLTPFFGFNRDIPTPETHHIRQAPVSNAYSGQITPTRNISGSPTATPQITPGQASLSPGYTPAQRQAQAGPTSMPGIPSSSPLTAPAVPGPAHPPLAPDRPRSRKRLYIISAVVFVVLLIAGAGAFAIFSRPAPNNSNVVVGQVHFSSSAQAQAGSDDQMQIDLSNVPPPPSGKVYYAWIESASSETDRPHWKLTFANGAVHASGLTYPGYKNLLLPNRILLITVEDANQPPTIPYPALSARRYYAVTDQTSSATFNVIQCPSSTTTNICLQ